MKTNQVMLRKMGIFDISQRSSDGYFNATELLKKWNFHAKVSEDPKVQERRIDHFWHQDGLTDLMAEIAENELGFKSPDFGDLKSVLSKTSRGKKNGGTWMHPVLFVKFAMYLNPRFEYHVLKFVSDQMLQYRNKAGDAYREMSGAVRRIAPANALREAMQKVGEALNWVVFGKHDRMMRNKEGEEQKMKDLYEMERKVTDLINEGFITDFAELMGYLRNQWRKRHSPQVFQSNVVINIKEEKI